MRWIPKGGDDCLHRLRTRRAWVVVHLDYATQDRGLRPESESTARGVPASSFIASATSTRTPTDPNAMRRRTSQLVPVPASCGYGCAARPPAHSVSTSGLRVEILLRTPHTVMSALGSRRQSRYRSPIKIQTKKIPTCLNFGICARAARGLQQRVGVVLVFVRSG